MPADHSAPPPSPPDQPSRIQNIATYNAEAALLAARYNALSTPDIIPDFARLIEAVPDKTAYQVLDLGCGSGRDAYWLAQQGVNVIACDGAAAMLAQARAQHSHPHIQYMQDDAPALPNLRARGLKYDMVLMGAFLFHFDTDERQRLYSNLTTLLRPQAQLYITLRHGPVPQGRRMYDVSVQELEDFAQSHGGDAQYHGRKDDPLNRPGVFWDHVSIQLP